MYNNLQNSQREGQREGHGVFPAVDRRRREKGVVCQPQVNARPFFLTRERGRKTFKSDLRHDFSNRFVDQKDG